MKTSETFIERINELSGSIEQFLFAAIDDATGECVDWCYRTGDLETIYADLCADADRWSREWFLIGTGCSILGNVDGIHIGDHNLDGLFEYEQ